MPDMGRRGENARAHARTLAARKRRLRIGGALGSLLIASGTVAFHLLDDDDLTPAEAKAAAAAEAPQSTAAPTPLPTTASTPEAQPAPAADTGLKEGGRTATVTVSGDLLWHDKVYQDGARQAAANGTGDYDFTKLFEKIKPIIESADLSICHEETPIVPEGGTLSSFPVFGTPAAVAPAIKDTGFDYCTLASNHSMDQGIAGITATTDAFDAAGLMHTGMYRTQEEADTPNIFTTAQGVKIAVVTGTYDLNGFSLPTGSEYAVDEMDADLMIEKAERARAAGADIVMAAVHTGIEYQLMPSPEQEEMYPALAASDAIDVIYGHHSHIVQPWDRINGKLVIYGLGNLVAQQDPSEPRTFEGVIGKLTFAERNDGRFEVVDPEYIGTLLTVGTKETGAIQVLPVADSIAAGYGPQTRLNTAMTEISKSVHALGVEGVE